MKSALANLLASENAKEVLDFLRTRGPRAHIVAPEWVRSRTFPDQTIPDSQQSASWSVLGEALGEADGQKSNFVVVAEDAEQERAVVNSLGGKKGRKSFGLFGHVLPALLCSANGMAIGRVSPDLTRYAVVCVPRSGSRYLSAVLSNRGVGAPREHIREPLARIIAEGRLGFPAAIEALEKFGHANRIFGTKLISTFLIHASGGRMSAVEKNISWMADRGYRFVRLDRPVVETAISSYIAYKMRTWHFFGDMDESARGRLDTLEFEEGAAFDEYIRLRAEKIVIDTIATSLNMPTFTYARVEADADGVVADLCRYIGVNPGGLEPGSARIPVTTRTESSTYSRFAEQLEELLRRRAPDIGPHTVRRLRRLTALSFEATERLVKEHAAGTTI